MTDRLREIRRYPVKSMGGEPVRRAVLDERGLVGDRWYAVTDAEGRLASGKNSRRFRRRDAVFDYAASIDPTGATRVRRGGQAWAAGDPGLDAELSARMGAPVRVLPEGDVHHQDSGAVSLVGTATLAWCARVWGGTADPYRLRPNLVVETTEPFVEEEWVGRTLQIGSAELAVGSRIPRCRMVDIAQDGGTVPVPWLKAVTRDRDQCLAVYLDVVRPGELGLDDRVVVR